MPAVKKVWDVGQVTPGDPFEVLMYLVRRLLGDDVAIVPLDLSGTVAWQSYLVNDDSRTLVTSGDIAISGSVLDPPLSGSAWSLGSPSGFNFVGPVPGDAVPTGNSQYLVRFEFTLAGTEDSFEEWATVRTLDVPVP